MLTRLPSGLAVAPALAVRVLTQRFDEPPLRLGDTERNRLLHTLTGAGIVGGASYDGLVALEANAHAHTLLTLDNRAQATYQRLGAEFTVIAA